MFFVLGLYESILYIFARIMFSFFTKYDFVWIAILC